MKKILLIISFLSLEQLCLQASGRNEKLPGNDVVNSMAKTIVKKMTDGLVADFVTDQDMEQDNLTLALLMNRTQVELAKLDQHPDKDRTALENIEKELEAFRVTVDEKYIRGVKARNEFDQIMAKFHKKEAPTLTQQRKSQVVDTQAKKKECDSMEIIKNFLEKDDTEMNNLNESVDCLQKVMGSLEKKQAPTLPQRNKSQVTAADEYTQNLNKIFDDLSLESLKKRLEALGK